VAQRSAFFVWGAFQALALLVLIVAGWAAPQQAFAAAGTVNAVPSLEASSRQLRTSNPLALDPPGTSRCALSRKGPLTESLKQNRFAGDDAPADSHAILTAAGFLIGESGQDPQHCQADRGIKPAYPAAFQSRAPPSLTNC
jgi:hypothetical protein